MAKKEEIFIPEDAPVVNETTEVFIPDAPIVDDPLKKKQRSSTNSLNGSSVAPSESGIPSTVEDKEFSFSFGEPQEVATPKTVTTGTGGETIFQKPISLGEAVVSDKTEKGNRAGYLYNSFLEGIGSLSAAATDLMIQLGSNIPGAIPEGEDKNEAIKRLRSEMLPAVREGTKELAGVEVSEEKQKKFNDEFVTSAFGGLTKSVPAMISPYGVGLLLQGYDSGLQSINSIEEGQKLPETTKTIFASGVGVAQGILEKIGLDKIFGKQSSAVAKKLAIDTFTDLLKKSSTPITAEIYDQAINVSAKKLKDKLLSAGGKIGKGGVVEFSTGALQESSNVLAENILNASQDKDVFEPQSWGETFGRILYSGGQEAVGGLVLGGVSVPVTKTQNYISEKVSEAQSPEDIEAIKFEMTEEAQKGNLREDEIVQINDVIDKYAAIHSSIPQDVENKKEVADKIIERDQLKSEVEGKAEILQNVDEAFRPKIEQEINILNDRIQELNNEISGTAQPEAEIQTEGEQLTQITNESKSEESSSQENGSEESVSKEEILTQDGATEPVSEEVPEERRYLSKKIADLYEVAQKVKDRVVKEFIRPVTKEEVNIIKEKTGIDIDDEFEHTIDNYAITHIINEHGTEEELKRGQIPVTKEDFEKIPEVIENYDSIESAGKNRIGRDIIRYTKEFPDGTTYVVEEVRTGRKELAVQTLYKKGRSTDELVAKEPRLSTSETISVTSQDKGTTSVPESQVGPIINTIVQKEPKEGELKSFIQTVEGSEKTTEELNERVKELDKFYKEVTNKESISKADKKIRKNPYKSKEEVLSDSSPSAEKSAMAVRLIKHFESVKDYDSAIEVLDSYDKQLREAGRFIQAASLWNKLSPETIVRVSEKEAKKIGKELPKEVKKTILKKARELDGIKDQGEKDKATLELLNYISEQIPPTASELFDSFRYQNMLSNPRSHLRNTYSNVFNTFISRPLDMIGESSYDIFRDPFNPIARDTKLSDIPNYYKQVFSTLPNAMQGFSEAFRNGYISDKILEGGISKGTIESLRRTKLPKALTLVPRFMEAQDAFFSILIGQGEKARLMKSGTSEGEAANQGKKLAEKYLYREKLGTTSKDSSLFVRALDGLGQLANRGRELPVIGKPWSWFVPFVTTPINIAKFQVERSPLGFIGGKYSKEQIANATLGTLIMGIGALLAAEDKTTWAPPRDDKEKEFFYASGRKPYSIKLGDTWVPLIYLGPYALAFALPAALKHYQEDSKEALTDSDAKQVADAALSIGGYVASQTPLSGVGGFVEALQGNSDYKNLQTLGLITEQAIPLSGFVKFVNTIYDPIYRRAKGYTESIEKDLPVLSKELDYYKTPSGEPAERDAVNYFLPYDIGLSQEEFELPLERRRTLLQEREKLKVKN